VSTREYQIDQPSLNASLICSKGLLKKAKGKNHEKHHMKV